MERNRTVEEIQALRDASREAASLVYTRLKQRVMGIAGASVAVLGYFFLIGIPQSTERTVRELVNTSTVGLLRSESDSIQSQLRKLENDFQDAIGQTAGLVHRQDQRLESLAVRLESWEDLEPSAFSAGDKVLEQLVLVQSESEARRKELLAIREEVERLKEVQEQANTLIVAMGEMPGKSLAVPMLRRDLDSLSAAIDETRESFSSDLAEVQARLSVETSRIYDLGKWFLGLLFAASVVPLVESLRRSGREASEAAKGLGERAKEGGKVEGSTRRVSPQVRAQAEPPQPLPLEEKRDE